MGERKCLRPGALGERWIEILVSLSFDYQHAKPKPLVTLNERILKIIAKAFRDFRNGEGRKLTAQPAHLRVEGIPLVAARDERFTSLGVERLGAGPDAKPSESVGFGDEIVWVRGLSEDGRAQQGREQRTDDADQVKTVARHDSLPRFVRAGGR